MATRRTRKVLGLVLALALATLPLTVSLGIYLVEEWQWRSTFPNGKEARSLIDSRVREVAAGWQAMPPDTRRGGFTPLQALTLEPAGGVPAELEHLVVGGLYWLRTELSAQRPPDGHVRFANAESMAVPLVAADQAFRELREPTLRGGCPAYYEPWQQSPTTGPCVALPVTAAQLGEVPLHTSRGLATVPAWLFSVPGLSGPVARVAVSPEAISAPPSPAVRGDDRLRQVLVGAEFIERVDGASVQFLTKPTFCHDVIRPVAYETAEVVVLGLHTEPERNCAGAAGERVPPPRPRPFTVELAEPVGTRALLSSSGNLVPYLPPGQLYRPLVPPT